MTLLTAHAEQYKSEVRELPGTPGPAQAQDAKQLLEQTADPYEKALLLRELAGKAVGDKEYEKAAQYLEQAIKQNALSAQAVAEMRKELTQLLVAGGSPQKVVQALEPQVRNNPNASAEQQAALGGAYLQLKRYKDAMPLLQKAVAANPNPDESWLQALYAAYANTGHDKEAIPVLEKLVRRNPGQREYWLQLAFLLHQTGQKERALAVLELASRQGHVQSVEERLQLVGLTAQLGAPFEAGSLMHAWMKDGQIPRNAQNLEALAGFWMAARESALAVSALNEAQKLAEDPGRSLRLGQLHMDRDDYAAAAFELNEGLQEARSDKAGSVLLALGVASFNAGNVDGARQAFTGAQRFPYSSGAAEQWLKFIESSQAREAAIRMARARARGAEDVALSSRLTGDAVTATPSFGGDVRADLRRIGERLTPVGAERDPNADGTIPEWTGGLTQPPPKFKPGSRLVDPYPDDKPLFTITAANAAKYASKLSAGHRALLAADPGYKMPVYPTRRSVAYPKAIYDATQANAGKARLVGSDSLHDARLGFPFPQPQNGVEAMWNHRVRYRGDSVVAQYSEGVVGPRGVSSLQKAIYRVFFRYANVKDPVDIAQENILLYGVTWFGNDIKASPAFVVLFHETADSIRTARGIWALHGGLRKMFRIPPVGYDRPLFGSEGLFFIDMIDMYNGAFDRYVWKLLGKRELYIPYNSYRLNDGRYRNAQLMTSPHFNQDATRYELHRVWVVEATERGGKTHAFGKRMFYLDEDSWNVVLVENHDRAGRPWRFQEGHLLPSYEVLAANTFPILTYDLKDGRYFVQRLLGEDPPMDFNVAMDKQDYMPGTVKNRYAR